MAAMPLCCLIRQPFVTSAIVRNRLNWASLHRSFPTRECGRNCCEVVLLVLFVLLELFLEIAGARDSESCDR